MRARGVRTVAVGSLLAFMLVGAVSPLACGGGTEIGKFRPGLMEPEDETPRDAEAGDGAVDAGFLPPLACAGRERIDTLGGVDETGRVAAVSVGGRHVVLWEDDESEASGYKRLVARQFDGTSWLVPLEVGKHGNPLRPALVGDESGNAFAQWGAPEGPRRRAFDSRTGAFGEATAFDSLMEMGAAAIVPLATGGALSAFSADGGVRAERWSVDAGWEDAGVVAPAAPIVHLATNRAGRALAIAYALEPLLRGVDVRRVHVSAFDGSGWSPSVIADIPPSTGLYRVGVLPDGSGMVVSLEGDRVRVTRIRPQAGAAPTVSPSELVHEGVRRDRLTASQVAVDALGRVTLAWVGSTIMGMKTAYVVRDVGGGWGPVQALGFADRITLALDPSSNVVALTAGGKELQIQRAASSSMSWSAPATTRFSDGELFRDLDYHAAVGFTPDGAPVVFAMQYLAGSQPRDVSKRRDVGVFAVTCR